MSWPDYLKTKGNMNIKLWDFDCLHFTQDISHMELTVNKPYVRRFTANWNPCACALHSDTNMIEAANVYARSTAIRPMLVEII